MTVHNAQDFFADRLEAVRRFAQTMIVVDDEAELRPIPESIPEKVTRPSRRQARAAASEAGTELSREHPAASPAVDQTHLLDGKVLIDSALDHGLVCSVLRPRPGEDVVESVTRAAKRVDIICLDWKINNDDGFTTLSLIREIVTRDQLSDGRLRLIVIYTAEHGRSRILDRIKREISSAFSNKERSRLRLRKVDGREIQSSVGLKVVYMVKAHNGGIPRRLRQDRVSEKDLPEQALREFATLCDGLLSTVALGTVAAVRDAAHEIVGSFGGELDGPYFHHRSLIGNPDEAADYAVNAVLGGFRAAVRLREVGRTFAGRGAVERRLRTMASDEGMFRLSFKRSKDAREETVELSIEDVIRLVRDGFDNSYDSVRVNEKPKKGPAKRSLTSLFASNLKASQTVMRRFVSLTSIASHPGTHGVRAGEYVPSLGLGTVVVDTDGKYWLCIQASCDSVRVQVPRPFLFVPLVEVSEEVQHVVPRERNNGRMEHVALNVEKLGYARGRSITFAPDAAMERVVAKLSGKPKRLRFKNTSGRTFEWIADLKHYQALGVAQKLGYEMSRLGFDEFEPFRKETSS